MSTKAILDYILKIASKEPRGRRSWLPTLETDPIFGPSLARNGENGPKRQISQRTLMANFFCEFISLVFPWVQVPPKKHAQNCRHSSPISFTFSNPNIFHADYLLTGETKLK